MTSDPNRANLLPRFFFATPDGALHLLTLLIFTSLNLVFDSFSHHMRATLKSLQHFIDAYDCSGLQPQKKFLWILGRCRHLLLPGLPRHRRYLSLRGATYKIQRPP